MADCGICKKPVVTHRYVRAKRLDDKGEHVFVGVAVRAVRMAATAADCTGHPAGDVVLKLRERFPNGPVRLLWAPEPEMARTLSIPSPAPARAGLRAAHASGALTFDTALATLLAEGATG